MRTRSLENHHHHLLHTSLRLTDFSDEFHSGFVVNVISRIISLLVVVLRETEECLIDQFRNSGLLHFRWSRFVSPWALIPLGLPALTTAAVTDDDYGWWLRIGALSQRQQRWSWWGVGEVTGWRLTPLVPGLNYGTVTTLCSLFHWIDLCLPLLRRSSCGGIAWC